MTPAKAATVRGERIEGKRKSRKEIRAEQAAKKLAEKSRWTIEKLWTEYKAQKGNYSTLRTDKSNYKHIEPLFGDKEPSQLVQLDIDRLRIKLSKKKPQAVKHVLNLLKRLINFGVNKGLCRGPNFKIEMPRVKNLKTEDLNEAQLKALLKAIDKDEDKEAANMMLMALFTGMRRGELFKLKWEALDLESGFIHIRDPKGGPSQIIPMNHAAREVLEKHPRTDSAYVFPGKRGGQRTEIRASVNRIRERAKLPKDFRPFHGLRHLFASMLASRGQVDITRCKSC